MANIFKEAKKLQRKHPRLEWQEAIKKASKARKQKPVRKSASKSVRKTTRRPAARPVAIVVATDKMTVAQLKSRIRQRLIDRENSLVLKKYRATTKRDRNKYQKEISSVRKELRTIK